MATKTANAIGNFKSIDSCNLTTLNQLLEMTWIGPADYMSRASERRLG